MARTAVFLVQRRSAVNTTISVDYTTVDGTATAVDGDYTPASGTLVFAPGETEKEVRIIVRSGSQPDVEAFTLQLSNPVKARIDVAEGTATIPAGASGLEALFPNRDLTVLFYPGEKHPGGGGGLSDDEWDVAPVAAQQADGSPFPGYMGQFALDAGPFVVHGGDGPIQTLSGWWLHYLIADQGGTSVIQILFGTSAVVPPTQTLDPAMADDFNAWWDAKGNCDILLIDSGGTTLKRLPLPLPTTSGETEPTTYRVAYTTDTPWPQDQPDAIVKFQIVPRED